jgi:flagellar biosynthesis anti-sigma factor FlgM
MEIPEKGSLRMLPVQNKSTEALSSLTAKPSERRPITAPADSVRLTTKGNEFAAAVKGVQGLPDIREDRVMRLKRQLEEGTYRIEGGRIAANMLNESIENNSVLEHIDNDESVRSSGQHHEINNHATDGPFRR